MQHPSEALLKPDTSRPSAQDRLERGRTPSGILWHFKRSSSYTASHRLKSKQRNFVGLGNASDKPKFWIKQFIENASRSVAAQLHRTGASAADGRGDRAKRAAAPRLWPVTSAVAGTVFGKALGVDKIDFQPELECTLLQIGA